MFGGFTSTSKNTSHSQVGEFVFCDAHASEPVIDRGLAREGRAGQAESGPLLQEQTVQTIIAVCVDACRKTLKKFLSARVETLLDVERGISSPCKLH